MYNLGARPVTQPQYRRLIRQIRGDADYPGDGHDVIVHGDDQELYVPPQS
jgi:hypothetical protein